MRTQLSSIVRRLIPGLLAIALNAFADESPSAAEGTPADAPPTVQYVPAGAAPADAALLVRVNVTSPEKVAAVNLHYRRLGEHDWRSARFQRSDRGDYVAQLPAAEMAPGVMEYWIGSASR